MAEAPADSNAAAPPSIEALIAKHRQEIDRVKVMEPRAQMQVFADLGVDPLAIERHYKTILDQDAKLRREDAVAATKTNIAGWVSTIAGGAVAYINRAKISPNKVVQAMAVTLATFATGLTGMFAASRIFSGKIREDSKQLGIEAKNAFERELAVALENRDTERLNAPSAPPHAVTPRDASYAVQAAADKTRARNAERQHA